MDRQEQFTRLSGMPTLAKQQGSQVDSALQHCHEVASIHQNHDGPGGGMKADGIG